MAVQETVSSCGHCILTQAYVASAELHAIAQQLLRHRPIATVEGHIGGG